MTLEQAAAELNAASSFFSLSNMSPKDFGSALSDAATRIETLEKIVKALSTPVTPPPAA